MPGVKRQVGITLIELIISMVIISIALTGVISVMNLTVRHSADPVLQHQALAVAESYLEEILLQSYADPDGSDGESNRALFDDVDDYDGLNDSGAVDQLGNAIAGLTQYNVAVSVAAQQTLSGGVKARRVTVNVGGPDNIGLSLVGYKTDY